MDRVRLADFFRSAPRASGSSLGNSAELISGLYPSRQ